MVVLRETAAGMIVVVAMVGQGASRVVAEAMPVRRPATDAHQHLDQTRMRRREQRWQRGGRLPMVEGCGAVVDGHVEDRVHF